MSDSLPPSGDGPPSAPPVSELLLRQRAAMAKARAARGYRERKAEDIRRMPPPVTAERAEPAREVSLPEAEIPTRRRRHERTLGGFDIPAHRKKPGWDYQYITIRVLNEPVDSARLRDFREGGWRPVPARDMPELVDENTAPDAAIETEGQRLYMRPMSLTMEARQEDRDYAYQQQHDRMIAAASGQSAERGHEGIPDRRGVKTVPVQISIVGEAG